MCGIGIIYKEKMFTVYEGIFVDNNQNFVVMSEVEIWGYVRYVKY